MKFFIFIEVLSSHFFALLFGIFVLRYGLFMEINSCCKPFLFIGLATYMITTGYNGCEKANIWCNRHISISFLVDIKWNLASVKSAIDLWFRIYFVINSLSRRSFCVDYLNNMDFLQCFLWHFDIYVTTKTAMNSIRPGKNSNFKQTYILQVHTHRTVFNQNPVLKA